MNLPPKCSGKHRLISSSARTFSPGASQFLTSVTMDRVGLEESSLPSAGSVSGTAKEGSPERGVC
jgi:hypothetical protein